MLKPLAGLGLAIAVLAAPPPAPIPAIPIAAAPPPNIVIILADDMYRVPDPPAAPTLLMGRRPRCAAVQFQWHWCRAEASHG